MAKIIHLCSWFDPAGDVYRCVEELKKNSVHEHDLVVRAPHPSQETYRLPEPASFELDYNEARFAAADAIVCHFVGWPPEWPEPPARPMAFRNINIRYEGCIGHYWCEPQYNATDQERYSIFAASHVGASEFFEEKKFRWLPDLLDIWSPELTPDYSDRQPCLSYIKHAEALDFCDLGTIVKQNLNNQKHATILDRRRRLASVVIDNLGDGHWGLSGQESIALGLPVFVFNEKRTHEALRNYVGVKPGVNDRLDHLSLPFGEMSKWVPQRYIGQPDEMAEVIAAAQELLAWPKAQYDDLRRSVRAWTERHFDSKKLVAAFWDPFCDELLAEKPIVAVRANA